MEDLVNCLRTSNCYLERIYIYSNPISTTTTTTTRDSVVGFYDSKLYDEFEYYMELNAHGQRALIRNICKIENDDETDDTKRGCLANVNINGNNTHARSSSSNGHNIRMSNATSTEGRKHVRSSLLPYILTRVNNQPELVYGLLQEAPYVWC